MEDFYFAYNYDPAKNTASKLCRYLDYTFEYYDKDQKKWVVDNELCRIFIGEDIYYDEITEEQAERIIANL